MNNIVSTLSKEVSHLREALQQKNNELGWYIDLATKQEQKLEAIKTLLDQSFSLDLENQILNILNE